MKSLTPVLIATIALSLPPFLKADEQAAPPTRIVIECEEMTGVDQEQFGPGPGWQVGRWGYDLYQNMIFGGVWASRLRNAMTDESDSPAAAASEIEVPADGTYKVWAKYECPPFFNYPFGIKIETADGVVVFDHVYGLRTGAKHFCFTKELQTGDLYWAWGLDHDAAEAFSATLQKGRHQVTLYKAANVAPSGARSVDAILITSDLAELSAPRLPRYPLLDELRRENHVYFRFRNPAEAPAPIKITWNHWNHRYVDFYAPTNRKEVKFYDEGGAPLAGGKGGDWPEPIPPGGFSPWYDLGPTMNTESTSPCEFQGYPADAKATGPSAPLAVDIALRPNAGDILKSFDLRAGEWSLTILVQPDLHRPEGVALTRKIADIYREVTAALAAEPRLGPVPSKLKLFGGTGAIAQRSGAADLPVIMPFRQALGLNTIPGNSAPAIVQGILDWGREHGGIIERSLAFHHTQDPAQVLKWVADGGVREQFYYLSFGDEIGLPRIDDKDPAKVEAFRDFVRAAGETPESMGLESWDQVKPLAALSADVAIKIGVLPGDRAAAPDAIGSLKRLYWHSLQFRADNGIRELAEKTATIRAALGPEVHTTANLGGMHPFYWMHQAAFIESFKHHAMSLAWSEDYTYCMPEGSRLVVDFETAYLRKGASYHDQPMMFYCMPHWPGNTPEQLLQCAVLEWGQNVKDLDFFHVGPDAWSTENYIAWRGGLPTWKMIRTISGMAGLIEDHLLPARTVPADIALLLSEASDVWELGGHGQWDVKPGSKASNVSQEERKAIWYALRSAGYRVDLITEADCVDGLLGKYQALYVCGENLQRSAATAIAAWVRSGGNLIATAAAARKDEFDAPLTTLDAVLGRGRQLSYQRHHGPLRARLELLFATPLDAVSLAASKIKVLCSRETFEALPTAEVNGRYNDGSPALITTRNGGRATYAGFLPGQAYLQRGLPVIPCGKGGTQTSPWLIEAVDFDAAAAAVLLEPLTDAGLAPAIRVNARGVVTNRLSSPKSTVVTIVNLAQQIDGDLHDVTFEIRGLARQPVSAWSCFHRQGTVKLEPRADHVVVTLPTLAAADVLILE